MIIAAILIILLLDYVALPLRPAFTNWECMGLCQPLARTRNAWVAVDSYISPDTLNPAFVPPEDSLHYEYSPITTSPNNVGGTGEVQREVQEAAGGSKRGRALYPFTSTVSGYYAVFQSVKTMKPEWILPRQ